MVGAELVHTVGAQVVHVVDAQVVHLVDPVNLASYLFHGSDEGLDKQSHGKLGKLSCLTCVL